MVGIVNGTSPWKWIPIASAIVVGTIAAVSALYQIFHVTYEAQANTAALAALSARVDRAEDISRTNEAAVKAMQRDINEIETQFCAADDLRNITHAADLRNFAMLYEKIYGVPYQIGNTYFPKVCNRRQRE